MNQFEKQKKVVLFQERRLLRFPKIAWFLLLFSNFVVCSSFIYAQDGSLPSDDIPQKQSERVLLPENELILTQISDAIIIKGGWYTNTLYRFESGLLLAHGGIPKKSSSWWQVSMDGGVKWLPYVKKSDKDHTLISPHICKLSNGSVIGWGGWNRDTTFTGRPGKPVKQSIMRAASVDEIIKGGGVEEEAMVNLPYMIPLTGDNLQSPPVYMINPCTSDCKCREGDTGC